MRERKKTDVHGTLEMIPVAWKFNSKQLLFKTLNSRINIIETRAVLNIVKTDGTGAPQGKRGLTTGPQRGSSRSPLGLEYFSASHML